MEPWLQWQCLLEASTFAHICNVGQQLGIHCDFLNNGIMDMIRLVCSHWSHQSQMVAMKGPLLLDIPNIAVENKGNDYAGQLHIAKCVMISLDRCWVQTRAI